MATDALATSDWSDKIGRGLSVFPVGIDKMPAVDPVTGFRVRWQDLKVTQRNLAHYTWPGAYAAVKCGRASNNLECADFDNKEGGEAARNLGRFQELLEDEIPGLYERLYIEQTKSGGFHLMWHCPEGVEGNQLLAKRPATPRELAKNPQLRYIATIETRGEGGYVVVAPASNYEVVQGSINSYPVLTAHERTAILDILRSLTQVVTPNELGTRSVDASADSRWRLRPGDDFNRRGRDIVVRLLIKAGWTEVQKGLWRRPGKLHGHSATLDYIPGVFFPFSSNAAPFIPGQPYDYFGVYAMLAHEGDFSAAASTLLSAGFGKGLPRILKTQDAGQMVRDTWRAFQQGWESENEPQIYRGLDGSLTLWRRNPDTWQPEIVSLGEGALRLVVQANSFWCTLKERKDEVMEVPSTPPAYVLQSLIESVDKPVPTLRRVVGVPVFVRDSTGSVRLHDRQGFDAVSGVYYAPSTDPIEVPEHPTQTDVDKALSVILDDLFVDFPFADDASKAHAVALLLLPYVRGIISGPTPFHLVDAPIQGSGKGLCVQAALGPYFGQDLAFTSETESSDEWRKRLLALARQGAEYIWLDNITQQMDWAACAAALTSQSVKERVLGSNDIPSVPLKVVWAGTANNAAIGDDMVRRIVYIRLNWTNKNVEDPSKLAPTQFKHPNLLKWVHTHRAAIVQACLVLCRAGLQRKAPTPAYKNSFDEWSEIIGSILEGVGVTGFLQNDAEIAASVDATVDTVFDLIHFIYETFGDRDFGAKDVVEALTLNPMVLPSTIKSPAKYIGRMLAQSRDKVIGGYVIRLAKSARNAGHRWHIRKTVLADE